MRPRPIRSLVVAATAAAVLACPVAAADARTYLFDGGALRMHYKPRSYAAGGVGASARMERIRWSSWGSRRAVGRGTAANNTCDPSCAEGSIERERGRLVLSRPRTCRSKGGKRYRFFSRVRYTAGETTTIFPTADLARYNCRR